MAHSPRVVSSAELIEAARLLMVAEPDLAKHFSINQLSELTRIFVKRLKLAAALSDQTED